MDGNLACLTAKATVVSMVDEKADEMESSTACE